MQRALSSLSGGVVLTLVLFAVLACSGSGSSPSSSRAASTLVAPSASSGGAGTGPSGAAASGSSGASASASAAGRLKAAGALTAMGFDCTKGDDIATNRIMAFEKAYPDVKLACTEGGLDDQQLLTAVRSGSPPDIIYVDRSRIGAFASKQAIQPLDACVADAGVTMADFRDAAVNQVTLNGKPYGIPEFFNVVVFVVNNKVARDAGVDPSTLSTGDWQGLTDANGKMLKKAGSKISRIGIDPKMPEFLPLWARIDGADVLSDDGKTSNLDDPKVAEALTFARDLIQAHGKASDFFAARDALSPDFFGAGNPMASGVLGGFPIEQFFLNVMAGNSPDVDITVTAPTGKDGQPTTYATGLAWAIPTGAKHPEAACAMAASMTSSGTWIGAAEARAASRKADGKPYTGTYTGNKLADAEIFGRIVDLSAMPAFDKAVKATVAVSDQAFAIPATGASVEFEAAWREAVNRVLNEGADPAAALKEADATAQAALDAAK
jgi:multiple sugar transport system substrate-binding protein